ncbi:MAG: putative polyhydroxyalkanoate system protein [Myxococcota bacterium]|jgi:putative polyhydroxyalkanoate system protein
MPKIKITKKHSVPMDQAEARVKKIVEDFTANFARIVKRVDWADDGRSATAKGKGFTGQFGVSESEVSVDIDLSFMATPFKSRVETEITQTLNSAFPE